MYRPQLILIYLLNFFINSQSLCEKYMSVDLSKAQMIDNDFLMNGTRYNNGNYFNDNGTLRGCICNIKNCIKKCCGPDEKYVNKICVKNHEQFHVPIYSNTSLRKSDGSNDFEFIYTKACPNNYVRIKADSPDDLFVQENGSLFVKNFDTIYDVEKYCIDTFNNETSAYLCEFYEEQFTDEQKKMLNTGQYIFY